MHSGNLLRDLRAAQDEADLRPVAVPNGDIPSLLDHIADVVYGFFSRHILIAHRLVLRIFN